MHVAVCQLALSDDVDVIARVAHNRAVCADAIMAAAKSGADLILLPERAQGGNVFASAAQASSIAEPAAGGPVLAEWCALSGSLGVVIVGGFIELGADDNVYNSCVLIEDGQIRAVYRKAHLFEWEHGVFARGNALPPVILTKHGMVSVLICYDAEFPEYFRLPCLRGADIVVVPVAWPGDGPGTPPGERRMDVVRLQAAAGANHVFVAAAGWGGVDGHTDWVGGSVILDCDGYPIAGPIPSGRPEILFAEIDLAAARDKHISSSNHVHADLRPALYQSSE